MTALVTVRRASLSRELNQPIPAPMINLQTANISQPGEKAAAMLATLCRTTKKRFVFHLPIESPICPDTMQPSIRPAIWIEVKVGLIQDRSHTRSNCGIMIRERVRGKDKGGGRGRAIIILTCQWSKLLLLFWFEVVETKG